MFRMPVADVFDIRTRTGPVVTGRIELGTVRVGDDLVFKTAERDIPVRVIAIEKFQQEGLMQAAASPDDVGLELTGITVEEAKNRGVLINQP